MYVKQKRVSVVWFKGLLVHLGIWDIWPGTAGHFLWEPWPYLVNPVKEILWPFPQDPRSDEPGKTLVLLLLWTCRNLCSSNALSASRIPYPRRYPVKLHRIVTLPPSLRYRLSLILTSNSRAQISRRQYSGLLCSYTYIVRAVLFRSGVTLIEEKKFLVLIPSSELGNFSLDKNSGKSS